jgi:hypothetical protein
MSTNLSVENDNQFISGNEGVSESDYVDLTEAQIRDALHRYLSRPMMLASLADFLVVEGANPTRAMKRAEEIVDYLGWLKQ